MNFLAHAYLSFGKPEILVGNMISDFVKGKRQYDYSPGIQQGIRLHRAIDDFTDQHDVSKEAKEFFRPTYRLYSGAFIDIVYDHFLANDREQFFNQDALASFASGTYDVLNQYETVLPPVFRSMLPFMEKHNWLYGYSEQEGIRRSFYGMARRAKYMEEPDIAYQIFRDKYYALESLYRAFFPGVKEFAIHQLSLM